MKFNEPETQPRDEGSEKQKKKKPNFNRPFIIAGIFLGIVSGIAYINILNLLLFAWAWVAGILAAKLLSKEFPRMGAAQGAVVGVFAGAIGSLIAGILITLTSVGGYYALGGELPEKLPVETAETWGYLYPPGQLDDDTWNFVSRLYPEIIKHRLYLDMHEKFVRKNLVVSIVVHFVTLEVAFCIFAGIGGFIGGVLFGRPLSKKEEMEARRRALEAKRGSRPKTGGTGIPKVKVKPAYAKPVFDEPPPKAEPPPQPPPDE
jgi:hypothetical protein